MVNSTIYRHYFYYANYSTCPTCYYGEWPQSADQRTKWSDWNNQFGSKFNSLWISGPSDEDEFSLLIGHAQNMSKSIINLWFDDNSTDAESWNWIYSFCNQSWLNFFIDRFERKYTYEWTYIGNGDACTDYQITSWTLTNIIDNNETRIRTR